MKEFAIFIAILVAIIVTPPLLIAGMVAFVQMDTVMLSPANWHQDARILAAMWFGLVVIILLLAAKP
jgi:hypothetical protein